MTQSPWTLFWEIFWLLVIWVPIVLLWGCALVDLLGHRHISGGAKAGWAALIVLVPIVGALIYFGLRPDAGPEPDQVAEHQAESAAQVVAALDRAAALHDAGRLSDQEYEVLKGRLTGSAA